jgi:hypothetical protein
MSIYDNKDIGFVKGNIYSKGNFNSITNKGIYSGGSSETARGLITLYEAMILAKLPASGFNTGGWTYRVLITRQKRTQVHLQAPTSLSGTRITNTIGKDEVMQVQAPRREEVKFWMSRNYNLDVEVSRVPNSLAVPKFKVVVKSYPILVVSDDQNDGLKLTEAKIVHSSMAESKEMAEMWGVRKALIYLSDEWEEA